jgi:hypothetical protein
LSTGRRIETGVDRAGRDRTAAIPIEVQLSLVPSQAGLILLDALHVILRGRRIAMSQVALHHSIIMAQSMLVSPLAQ